MTSRVTMQQLRNFFLSDERDRDPSNPIEEDIKEYGVDLEVPNNIAVQALIWALAAPGEEAGDAAQRMRNLLRATLPVIGHL